MRVHSKFFLPVLIGFPESEGRLECWGRILDLGALGARIATTAQLASREPLHLSFELHGESFAGLTGSVVRSGLDEDGYCRSEVRFASPGDRLRLGRVLRGLLASR